MLVLLNTKIKTLHKEKTDLEIKLAEAETQSVEATQTVRVLQNNLILVKDELKKLNGKELYDNALAKEIDTLRNNLVEKDHQIQICKMEIDKININHKTELLTIEKKFQSEYEIFKEKR